MDTTNTTSLSSTRKRRYHPEESSSSGIGEGRGGPWRGMMGPPPPPPPIPPSAVTPQSSTGSRTVSTIIRRGGGPKSVSTTITSRSAVDSLDEQCFIAVVEGRGQSRGEIGMACISLNNSNLVLCEFPDSLTYNRVIAKVVVFRPVHILMPNTCCESTGTASQLYLQLKKEVPNVQLVAIPRKNFNETVGLQRIKGLVTKKYSTLPQMVAQKYYCLAAAAALFQYIEVTKSIVFSSASMKVEFQGSENTCMIDSKTIRHLELLQSNAEGVIGESLLGILNKCRTPGGSRLLRMNILQPICDEKILQERLECIEELLEKREVICNLQQILSQLPMDIDQLISGLIQIPKNPNDRMTEQRVNYVIGLKHVLDLLPGIVHTLQGTDHAFFEEVRQDFQSEIFQPILAKIKKTVSEEVKVIKGLVNMRRQRYFCVKPGIDPVLDLARNAYIQLVDEITAYVEDLSAQHDMALRFCENIHRGCYLQLVLPPKGIIPNLPDTFIQVSKYRNSLNFTTQVLLSLDHRSREAGTEVEKMISQIISDLIQEIRQDISSIYTVSETIAKLDVIYALANYAVEGARVRPKFSKLATGITNGRHPLLERVLMTKRPVPNLTCLSEDINFVLLTGPNMSGKTTYLKQVATLQIMAQVGSFVPADAATFRIASNIFSRLGTGDNIEENASSFSMEMTEVSYILNNINDNSLVIVDELGRSTSVEEGTSISFAVAETLQQSKSFTLFATHYMFLTRLEKMYLNVVNYTMETQEWRLKEDVPLINEEEQRDNTPLQNYKLKYTHVLTRGVTTVEFYGLKLASASSFPAEVAQDALTLANKIVDERNKINEDTSNPEEKAEEESRKNLYLLGVQLKLAAEFGKDISKTDMQKYLRDLRQEVLNKFQDQSLSDTMDTGTP